MGKNDTGNAMTGAHFKGGEPHEVFPRASLMRRRVNEYFDDRDFKKKPYTVPGLALHLGVRTKVLMNYQYGIEYPEFQRVIDYALQRIEAYTAEQLMTSKGSTRGIEFLMQNNQGYANKSDVSSKTELELTEKEKVRQLPDSEVKKRLGNILPMIQKATEKQMAGGGG